MTAKALLSGEHLSHHFRAPSGDVMALHNLSLDVQEGEFVALVGPSGCGKTTLLRILGGLIQSEEGRVLYDGEPLTGPPAQLAMVFQKPTLLPWRSVWDNIRLPLEVAGTFTAPTTLTDLVEAVGLAGFERALPAELSGGMQQRVALARALVSQPRLLLMDEPFAALDMMLRHEMNTLLLTLWQARQPTVLFVTHDIHEAVFLADRVIVLGPRPGRIIGQVPITLLRPRSTRERYSPEAQTHVERIWHLLEREGK